MDIRTIGVDTRARHGDDGFVRQLIGLRPLARGTPKDVSGLETAGYADTLWGSGATRWRLAQSLPALPGLA